VRIEAVDEVVLGAVGVFLVISGLITFFGSQQ